jgi:dTMP kinase
MLITFEGIDSSGKSTQAKMLYDYLTSRGVDCVLTKEPGGSESANKIRSLILENDDFLPITQLLLINAARSENINNVIIPALQKNKIVLCDRFIDSTIVYQALKQNLGLEIVNKIHELVFNNLMPDATFYLAVSKSVVLKRMEAKKSSLFSFDEHNWMDDGVANKIEQMISFFNTVYKIDNEKTDDKLKNKSEGKKRIIKIDANQSPDQVFQSILKSCRDLGLNV